MPFERLKLVVNTSIILANWPTDIVGTALILDNNDDESDTVFSIDESGDKLIWGIVLLDTPDQANQTTLTIVPGGRMIVSFKSTSKHVRLKVASFNGGGLHVEMVYGMENRQEMIPMYS